MRIWLLISTHIRGDYNPTPGSYKGQSGRWTIFEREQGALTGLTDKVQLLHKTTLSRMEEVAVYLMHRPTQRIRLMKKQETMFQTKEQDKPPETNLNKIEMSDLPYREFKILIIKMFTEVRRAMPK